MKSEQEIREVIRKKRKILQKPDSRRVPTIMPLEMWELYQEKCQATVDALEWVLGENSD